MKPIWLVTIKSDKILSDANKDLIVEFIDHEAHKAIGDNGFILHDVLEYKKFSEVIIEGTMKSVINLLCVLKDNLAHKLSYKLLQKI
ncbi:MAG: hypothetical protein MSIBF_07205 [Candidatus Altiarchaeales archaeon IMC4]|nr:MAG: hypothetical protein MSIBF_07205 [Candidatus Altiarchaeales archaeon IMC4]